MRPPAPRGAVAALLLLAPAAGAQVLIDFDDRPAPSCAFAGAERLADQWAADGVVFSAPPGAQTSAIQDRDACGWAVSGHSPPNIAAHVAGLADLPLVMSFDPPVSSVSIMATNWRGIDDITLTAFDSGGLEVGRDTISTLGMVGPLQLLEVIGPGIVAAELTNTSFNDDVAFDDLRFMPEGPPALPGWTPDGASRPGAPLRLAKAGAGELRLEWSAGCSPEATGHAVHEGAIGGWYSHEAVSCGAGTEATLGPAPGGRYFLVAPLTASEEGSHGLDSFGAERPFPDAAACAPAQRLGCP